MALLTRIEAAIALGVGIDLLDWFIEKCPKPDDARRLTTTKVGKEQMIDEAELEAFRRYLREPWPVKVKNARPGVTDRRYGAKS